MEKSYLIMKDNNLIDEVALDKWKDEVDSLQEKREELSKKILSFSKRIEDEKAEVLRAEKIILQEIRKLLKDLTLKRYYIANKGKVDLIVKELKNDSIQIGRGLDKLKKIKEQLETCIEEQSSIDEEELKEIVNIFPQKEAEVLMKYLNSERFKNLIL